DVKLRKKYNYLSFFIDNYCGNFEKIKLDIEKFLSQKKTIIFCLENNNVAKRVINYLDIMDNLILTDENNIILGKVNIVNKFIHHGFILDNYVVITAN